MADIAETIEENKIKKLFLECLLFTAERLRYKIDEAKSTDEALHIADKIEVIASAFEKVKKS